MDSLTNRDRFHEQLFSLVVATLVRPDLADVVEAERAVAHVADSLEDLPPPAIQVYRFLPVSPPVGVSTEVVQDRGLSPQVAQSLVQSERIGRVDRLIRPVEQHEPVVEEEQRMSKRVQIAGILGEPARLLAPADQDFR